MQYLIGQFFGILVTVCCLIFPFFKKKWQMLLDTTASNLFMILNLLLLGEVGSGIIVCMVAILQNLLSFWHIKTDKPISRGENILFLILYVCLGLIGFQRIWDLLPVIGAVFNMLATFQRDEQRTRWLALCNVSFYFVYFVIIGSSTMLAELVAICSTVIALIKYRRK